MSARTFFTDEQIQRITAAIAAAEKKTSGEIRVHLEKRCAGDPVAEAEKWFGKLRMHETQQRNGVLIFLAIESRVFSIYGDQGINSKVPQGFWKDVAAKMEDRFRHGQFTEGLEEAIHLAGEQLQHYFPGSHNDQDELSNDVSYT